MTHATVLALALSSILSFSFNLNAAGFANRVIEYKPGTGFATEFGSGLGYTNINAVLGEPSRSTPGQFGGPVDPFNPPYLRDQILSIGTGGSLTVQFDSPILNLPGNPFGLDFLIFGNSGFVITNGNFAGGGITDGTLFAANSGATRVSVSADNLRYMTLDPAVAPIVDNLFPTDGLGDFRQPVNPRLRNADFAGLGLEGIRSLYAGSGGGTGFDLSWALDESGRRVGIDSANYLRIEVLTGVSEIDGFAAVPEPSQCLLFAFGALFAWRFFRSYSFGTRSSG